MKKFAFFPLFLILAICTFGQSPYTEFEMYPNGLIYSEQTMAWLGQIVDSLNLQYRSCDLDRTYYALPQARGHYLRVEKAPESLKKDLTNALPFDELVARYPEAEIQRNRIVLRESYRRNGEERTRLSTPPYNFGWDVTVVPELPWPAREKDITGRYFWQERSNGDLEAFYFEAPFQRPDLPESYGRMVQYVDCLVDTTAYIPYDERFSADIREEGEKRHPSVERFYQLVQEYPGRPIYPEYPEEGDDEAMQRYDRDYDAYLRDIDRRDSLRLQYIEEELIPSADFLPMLREAIDSALVYGGYEETLEHYAREHLSADLALELMRRRRVIGFCSQDTRPREHAVQIAILSAETANWPVFLRAHLDVMNDRFDRQTDGTYAWASRETYLRELELLGINTPDLLIGSCLRVANPSTYHYYGSLRRVGRALGESSDPDAVEQQLLAVIRDDRLDDYNRLLMVYLYRIYCEYLPEITTPGKLETLRKAVTTLPAYMAEEIELEE